MTTDRGDTMTAAVMGPRLRGDDRVAGHYQHHY